MKLRDEKQKKGHLLTIISKKDRTDNFSFFFPVEGLSQFDTLLKISKGFEDCLASFKNDYDYSGYSISDFGKAGEVFPEIDIHRILIFEQAEFLSAASTFIPEFGQALVNRCIKKNRQIFPGIVTGAMASGSNFYDRNKDMSTIKKHLLEGKNILLRAPRRYGKTSLLTHITKTFSHSMDICFVDLEGGDSSEEFVELILKGILLNKNFHQYLPGHILKAAKASGSDRGRLDILRSERKAIRKDWKTYIEFIFHCIDKAEKDTPSVFILDEVSFLIEDMLERKDNEKNEVEELFQWFSKIRGKYKNIQFILSGSEHLPTFLNVFGIEGQLDDFQETSLNLFSKKIATQFIFLVFAGHKTIVSQKEIESILKLMGKPIPYFLQLFLDALLTACREKTALNPEQIKEVYYNDLLGSGSKRYFESIEKQLERYNRYGKRCRAGAKAILDKLAQADFVPIEELEIIWEETTGGSEQFTRMMEIMKDDFYIKPNRKNNIIFDSKLIKEWWFRHGL